MRNCVRLWSTKLRRLKFLASSAGHPLTYSRCSMLSSRVPRGFAGLTTSYCDSARGTLWLHGLTLVPYLMFVVRLVVRIHALTGCVNMAHCTYLTSARNKIS